MVVKVSSAVGIALIWIVTVAGVSLTAWFVIDRAGRDITSGAVGALPAVTLGSALQPAASASPEPSVTKQPSSTTPTSTASRDRTFSVDGGQVSVRCTGSTIRLRIAQPDNGWRMDVEETGPEEVKVNFKRGDDDRENKAEVAVVCSAGTPLLKAEDSR